MLTLDLLLRQLGQPAFERVHNGFHAVMEASGGHHEEHEEHHM